LLLQQSLSVSNNPAMAEACYTARATTKQQVLDGIEYIYKVFEHLEQLWMGIWQHTHTVTTTEVSPDLGLLAEILDDVSVEMIPLRYR
jgi:hypothetical protein